MKVFITVMYSLKFPACKYIFFLKMIFPAPANWLIKILFFLFVEKKIKKKVLKIRQKFIFLCSSCRA